MIVRREEVVVAVIRFVETLQSEEAGGVEQEMERFDRESASSRPSLASSPPENPSNAPLIDENIKSGE